MNRKSGIILILVALCCASAQAISFDWVTIGNPGNAPDDTGYGAVDYVYRISKYEVTNAQYVEFLNAVAATDSFSGVDPKLYNPSMGTSTAGGIIRSGSMGSYTYSVKAFAPGQGPAGSDYTYADKPVVDVSLLDAMRFANWLHNGQGSGGTESGVYNILKDGANATRSTNAKYWIPSEDEWYKAAYHDAAAGTASVYFNYPTGADSPPNNNLPSADTGNSANFYDGEYTSGDSAYPMTDVGEYVFSGSSYGTFDQGGNVWEWNEAFKPFSMRGVRGGSWVTDSLYLRSEIGAWANPAGETETFGFRLATVPEPNSCLLLLYVLHFVCGLRARKSMR